MHASVSWKAWGNRRSIARKILSLTVIVSYIVTNSTLLTAHALSAASGPLCYVNQKAKGHNNGNSWTDAYTDLQSALTLAACSEVWVAAGLYKPTSGLDRTISFHILPGTQVYGGFNGTETSLDQRNPATNLTVLSGDIDKNDVTDSNGIDQIYNDNFGFNTYHVVTIDGTSTLVTSGTTLDGFTITGGRADGTASEAGGGGLLCNGSGAGHQCDPSLANLTFVGNIATDGAAIFDNGSGGTSSPSLTDVTIRANAATLGGGMYNNGENGGTSSPQLTNVTIVNNRGESFGGGMYNDGALGNSSPILTNDTFSGNYGLNGGAAMANDAGGPGPGGVSSPRLQNVILWEDAESLALASGQEIYDLNGGTPTITHSVVQWGNSLFGIAPYWTPFTDDPTNTVNDPLLGPLANDGGYTETVAIDPGGSARDAGQDSGCPAFDQRFVRRPQGPHCDIGAYEYEYPFIPPAATWDSDLKTDPAVFGKTTGNWFALGSTAGFRAPALNFGNATNYIPVPGYYDYDSILDPAVFEKATGNWFVVGSTAGFSTPALNFGGGGNFIPVPADYDGDGITDPAVYDTTTGNWFVLGSGRGFFSPALGFGGAGFTPVPGDYDGDGMADPGVFQPSSGNWFAVGSGTGFMTLALAFGAGSNYTPVPGDYDGDGKTDPAVFEKSTGNWFAVGSMTGFMTPALSFGGGSNYVPVPGDYDGDGKIDPAVYQISTGNWFVVGSTAGFFSPALGFGNSSFMPVVPAPR